MATANMTAEESSLSSWAGPYVTQMLGRGAAASNLPYTAYQGPLTAGESGLQTQAYQGLGALQAPAASSMTYTPQSFTTPGVAASYMSPFLQSSLDPQVAAARRQAEISQQALQGQYGKAGAYGGSRQGVAEAELQRGLLDRLSGIYGTGYENAFQQAQGQFNAEQARQMAASQQAQRYGLDILGAQRAAGGEQRNIEQQGLSADLAQFEQERDYPIQQIKFMQSLLDGQPLETQSFSYYEPTGLQTLSNSSADILSLLRDFNLLPKTAGTTTGTKNLDDAGNPI